MYTHNLTGELSSYPLFLAALAGGRRHFYQERNRDAAAGADGNEPHPFSNVRPPHGTCTAVPVVQETTKNACKYGPHLGSSSNERH